MHHRACAFDKDVDAAVIWAHVEEQPTSPSAIQTDLPNQIDDVIARALAKDPGDRFATCREFVEAAQFALNSQPRPVDGFLVSPRGIDDTPETVESGHVSHEQAASRVEGQGLTASKDGGPGQESGAPQQRLDLPLRDAASSWSHRLVGRRQIGVPRSRRRLSWLVPLAALLAAGAVLTYWFGFHTSSHPSASHAEAGMPGGVSPSRMHWKDERHRGGQGAATQVFMCQ